MLNYDQPAQPIAIFLPLDMKLGVFLGDKVKGGIAILAAHIT